MTACQPTNFFQMISIQLWEPALLAMAACQPTNLCQMYSIPCGSWLASDGLLTADRNFDPVHIRCCGNGGLGFRPYGDSLFYKRQKK
jgi:hypothetical protein